VVSLPDVTWSVPEITVNCSRAFGPWGALSKALRRWGCFYHI
jgi:hypothetical protein